MQRQDFGKLHLSKSRALKADLRGTGTGGAEGGNEGEDDAVVQDESGTELRIASAASIGTGSAALHSESKKRRRE